MLFDIIKINFVIFIYYRNFVMILPNYIKAHSSPEFFDSIADTWDSNEKLSVPDRIHRFLGEICIFPGEKILDLGTGTGVLIPYMARLTGPKGSVTAVDFSQKMLDHAKAKFGDIANVRFRLCDFEKDFPDGRYDLVMMYCVYPHLGNPECLLKEIAASHLSDIGRIVIAFPCREDFINHVHGDVKADAHLLPPAPVLAERIRNWGLSANVIEYSDDLYILEIR